MKRGAVRLVFIDDSQQQQPCRRGLGHLLAIGAVIVPEQRVAPFAAALAAIRAEIGVPVGERSSGSPRGAASSPMVVARPRSRCALGCSRPRSTTTSGPSW